MLLKIIQTIGIKPVNRIGRLGGFENAGGKNEGMFNYVVENKYRKNVRFMAFHYITEKTRVIVVFPLCF